LTGPACETPFVTVPLLSAISLLSALVWTAALAAAPGTLAPTSVLLIATGLIATATVGMVGLTVTGARWAHRTSLAAVGAMLALALARPIDSWWATGLALTLVAGVALLSPSVTHEIRRLPAAAGPPDRAVLIPLLLIGLPFLLGLAAGEREATGSLVVGLGAPLAALWYTRVFPGGLVVIRVAWPALAVGLAPIQPLLPAAIGAGAGVAVAVLAWHPSVKTAFHPPREVGTVHPIPPELAPPQVLDAADIDERGRPRR
jgi:hypothetical protein